MTNEYTPQWESEYVCVIVYTYRDREKERKAGERVRKKKELGKWVDILRETKNDAQDDMQTISALVALCHYGDVIMDTITSQSLASRLSTQPFIQTLIKENIKGPRHWPLCGEFTGDRWIPRTNDQ